MFDVSKYPLRFGARIPIQARLAARSADPVLAHEALIDEHRATASLTTHLAVSRLQSRLAKHDAKCAEAIEWARLKAERAAELDQQVAEREELLIGALTDYDTRPRWRRGRPLTEQSGFATPDSSSAQTAGLP